MNELYSKNRLFFFILVVAVSCFLTWYFREIIICVLVAVIISVMGYPIVEFLNKLRIGKLKFPHTLSVILTLLVFIIFFAALLSIFVPLVIKEASVISSIDGTKLMEYYAKEIHWLEYHLSQFGVMKRGVTIETLIKTNLSKLLDFNLFTNLISGLLSFTGTFFFNAFTVLFLSFFFLFDITMFPRFVLLLVPEKYEGKTKNVMSKSKVLLSRYFTGLLLNVLVMIISYSIALTLVGAQGALVIAFFAGIVNIIPYIGPIIAVITGMVLGVSGVIGLGLYGAVWSVAFKIFLAMVIVILLDNFVYGPLIQGRSVKAHPVEIFLVIIAAGSMGGIPVMVIAVPSYAFLRIIAGEFLSQFRLVRSLTNKT